MDRRAFIKAGSIASVGALAGCLGQTGGDESGDDDTSAGDSSDDEPIVLGAIQPLSGPFSAWGNAHHSGLEFGVEQINENGGVLGRELEVVSNDTGSDPSQADSYFREFVEQEDAVAVTGPVSSDVGIRTSDVAQELETPLFLHMAGADAVVQPGREHAFRVGLLPASSTIHAQSQLIEEQGYERIGAVIGDYAWGRSIEESIEEYIDVDVQIEVAPVQTDDFRPNLRNLDDDIEMLIATGHPPGTFTITSQAYDIGLAPEAVTGPGMPPGVIRGALGELSEQGYLHFHMSDYTSDEYVDLAQAFTEDTGERFDTHHSYGYVTAQLLAEVIEEAGEANPGAITETVRGIEFDTLYPQSIQYDNFGELDQASQLYSGFTSDAPDYAPDGDWGLTEVFRSDPLPAPES